MTSYYAADSRARRSFAIGVTTYRRPHLLADLLQDLQSIDLGAEAAYWIYTGVTVIDNDHQPSARSAVEAIQVEAIQGDGSTVRYHHEPQPGLSAARNRALDEAGADVLVFIDDDERPAPGWPGGLLATLRATGAALVGGPVRTVFDHRPPGWVTAGRFFDRPEPHDRTPQTWLRSGNLAVDLAQIRAAGLRFDPRFGLTGGEDTAFTLEAARAGLALQWSATAAVTETVGPERTRLRWLMERERRSTANWVRIELDHHPGPVRRLAVLARAGARLSQGAALVGVGAVLGRRAVVARGCLRAARAAGALGGLARPTGKPAYGPGVSPLPGPVRCSFPPHTHPVKERPS